MKIIIQRVINASVSVDNKIVANIGRGIMALIGLAATDGEGELRKQAEKLCNLRIFPDENGRFHYSLLDIQAELLLVPQFTLLADTSKGRRPEFFAAMPPEQAKLFFNVFLDHCKLILNKPISSGIFGADMKVSLINDGPVTIILD